ncbi:MAG: nucleotide exchange factor GrpE [Bacteriovoracales bacterium]|nr:nucleotide exchange factor GrpE [Bacteriovoracales bacterium]
MDEKQTVKETQEKTAPSKTPKDSQAKKAQEEKEGEEKRGAKPKEENGKEEKEDFKSKYLYLAAELENQKKRFQKEREQLTKFGGEKILGDFLEVADNLGRTVTAIEKDEDEKVKNIVKGINMVKKQFLDKLRRHGLTPVESLGKDFDPAVHEAMAQEESDQEANKVISVFEEGYKLNGRLLRAAKVVVSK